MKESILVGLAKTIITPRQNVQMGGFARSQVSTGVHDDLPVCGLYLEDAWGRQALLLDFSLVCLSRELVASMRRGLQAKTGIPEEAIVFTCTHTHAGPGIVSNGYTVPTPGEYPSFLVQRAVACGTQAWRKRAPARVGFGRAEVFELGRNRRALFYGGLHPDPEVLIMKIENADGRLKGVAYNYGCHPSTLDWKNTLISGDWPHYADRAIQKGVGGRIWTAYLQGAEGDINTGYLSELSAAGVDMPIRDYWYIDRKGRQMSGAVLPAVEKIKTASDVGIDIARGYFDYPLREKFPITVRRARAEAAAAKKGLAAFEADPQLRGTRIPGSGSPRGFLDRAAAGRGRSILRVEQGSENDLHRAPGPARRRSGLFYPARRGFFRDRPPYQARIAGEADLSSRAGQRHHWLSAVGQGIRRGRL